MTVRHRDSSGPTFTRAGVRRGAATIAPLAIVTALFGMSFGVAATDRGIQGWAVIAMSATVMAGGAQFAAIELWDTPTPWIPITLTVLAINGRHFVFGASLGTWLSQFRSGPRHVSIGVLSDPSWAFTDRAVRNGEQDLGFLLGCGLGLWCSWVGGTITGVAAGNLLSDQIYNFGLDTLLVTYFPALLIPLWKGRSTLLPWVAAGVVAVWGREILPPGWHVIAAAACGGLVGAFMATPADQATA